MTDYKASSVNFDDLFDADIIGDGPAATLYKNRGTPLKYAALKYGTKRANVDYAQNGVDVSNLWAAKGSAKYTTSDDGAIYLSKVIIPNGQTDSARITLQVGAGKYIVTVYNRSLSGGGTSTQYQFSIPSGVTQFQAALAFASGVTTGVTKTDTPAWTAIPGALTQVASIVSGPRGGASGTAQSDWTLSLKFGAGSVARFSGTSSWQTETDGSA